MLRLWASGIGLAVACAAIAQTAGQPPLRALVLTGRHNHNWRETNPVLVNILEEGGRFTVEVTEDPTQLTRETLAGYDVVVSNWCVWPEVEQRPWGKQAEEAFLEFIRGGKGFALFHAASATMHTWPEFQAIIGSTWDLKQTGHGAIHAFEVKITDHDHPIMQGLTDFWITDELWHRTGKQPDIRVLATAFSDAAKGGSGNDEPVVLCTQFGAGRGFNLVLGHDARTMGNPAWRTLMLRGTEWAATGKVTIAPADPWPATREWEEQRVKEAKGGK